MENMGEKNSERRLWEHQKIDSGTNASLKRNLLIPRA